MKHSTATAIGVLMVVVACTARADVVTDWNATTNKLVANDVGNNPRLRTLAMVHVAMSDAINTVQNRYTRVVATLPAAPGASAEAAAATAARQILIQIYPEQKARIEDAYAASLKAIPDGPAKTETIKLGMEVAAAVQADCANDGTAPPTLRPTTTCANAGERARRPAAGRHAMFAHGIWWTCVALGALFLSRSAYSQDPNGVTHQYLQRHGIPCLFVLKVDSPHDFGEVATCQDGREWVLLWLEGEIAFVHPQTRELYKWDHQIYMSHPEIYLGPYLSNENRLLPSDGP
jgi:hypothetical protein